MAVRFNHQSHEPAVYDTNIWVHGLTEKHVTCAELVEKMIDGSQYVNVPAYVFEEVRLTFESGRVNTEKAEEHLNDFASIIHGSQNINGPTQKEVHLMNVRAVRKSAPAQAFGAATGSQPKDAPILWSAFQIAQNGCEVTIYSTDEEFSHCSPPPIHADGEVTMQYVE